MDQIQTHPSGDVHLGRVVYVSGFKLVILLESHAAALETTRESSLQIGTMVKFYTGSSVVYALVSGLDVPAPDLTDADAEMKLAEVALLGETIILGDGGMVAFQRGVSVYPTLGDPVFEATSEDLKRIYASPDIPAARIGALHQDKTLPAMVAVDDLLGKHFAVLGTTGSGKSCATTLILKSVLQQHENGHVLLLDIHNEYARAFADKAELVTPDTLELPFWLLTFDELSQIMTSPRGSLHHDAEVTILGDVVVQAKRHYAGGNNSDWISVDTPVPYRLSDLRRFIGDAAGQIDRPNHTTPYLRLKSRLARLQNDPRYAFMFPNLSVRDNLVAILARLFRIPVNGKPMTIVDLSGVPSEILNVVVSVLCRMTFDFALWNAEKIPMLLVCEEAHRYASADQALGFESAKRALARIAKEGRKYGLALGMISQRPSELAPEILSQCNTVFALRMGNQADRDFVRATMAESGLGLLDFLPALHNGEAIAVGEGVPVPVRFTFDVLAEDERPQSDSASFAHDWQTDKTTVTALAETIAKWRRQPR